MLTLSLMVKDIVIGHLSSFKKVRDGFTSVAFFNLPVLDAPLPPSMDRRYTHEHTKDWAAKIASLDALVFVTPDYIHSTCGALKNAIYYLFYGWHYKAADFVGYGSTAEDRDVEHLRTIMAELQIAGVCSVVGLSVFDDIENFSECKPREFQPALLHTGAQ